MFITVQYVYDRSEKDSRHLPLHVADLAVRVIPYTALGTADGRRQTVTDASVDASVYIMLVRMSGTPPRTSALRVWAPRPRELRTASTAGVLIRTSIGICAPCDSTIAICPSAEPAQHHAAEAAPCSQHKQHGSRDFVVGSWSRQLPHPATRQLLLRPCEESIFVSNATQAARGSEGTDERHSTHTPRMCHHVRPPSSAPPA